jgi:ATP-binding cassette subfamily B protein
MRGFTYYRQLEEMDCGAACLRMVAGYHGREFSLEDLRERSGQSRDGVSLLGISEGAESIGLQTLALPVDLERLGSEVPLPCIIPWKDDHFVVLKSVHGGRYAVADPDPEVREVTLDANDFLDRWPREPGSDGRPAGNVLVLEPTGAFYRTASTAEDGPLTRLLTYFRPHRRLLLNVGAGLVLTLIVQLMLVLLLKNLVDYGIVLAEPSLITLIVSAQLVLLVFATVLTGMRRYLVNYVGSRVYVGLLSDYLSRLLSLPLTYFERRGRSDVLQRFHDHDRLQSFLTGEALLRVLNLLSFVAFAALLLYWSGSVFLLFVAGTAMNVAWAYLVQRRRRTLDLRHFDQRSGSQDHLMELIDGIQEIKQHNAERGKRWAWEQRQAELYRTRLRLNELDRAQRTVSQFIDQGKNLGITLVASLAVVRGDLSIGVLVAIHYMLAHLSNPIEELTTFARGLEYGRVSMERIGEIMDKADRTESRRQGHRVIPGPGELRADNLTFRYPVPGALPVLNDLSFRIPPGRVTAIVGPSGSGKSTLLKLLLGHYRAESGTITLDGVPLAEFDSAFWRDQVGMVYPGGFLFTDTIARNIVLAERKVDEKKLLTVLQITQLNQLVHSLADGLQTVIGPRGTGLSEGQRQRILLARAIYRNPPYLFLDEATTGLDAFTELTLMDDLRTYLPEATIVVVAHRNGTFRRADHIIVLEDGQIVETGSHDHLMADRNKYYRLVTNQTLLGN